MSCRINRFHVAILGVVLFAVQAFAQPLPMDKQTNLAVLPIRVVNAHDVSDDTNAVADTDVVNVHTSIYLGQDEPPTERKGFGLADRLKRIFTNLTKDDTELDDTLPNNPQDSVRTITLPSVPTRPPKPPTASEIKESVENPDQSTERRTTDRRTTPERRRETTNSSTGKISAPLSDENTDRNIDRNTDRNIDSGDSEESIFQRMGTMRKQIFDKQHLNENAYRELNSPKPNVREPAVREPVVREPASNFPTTRPTPTTTRRTPAQRTRLDEITPTPQVPANPNAVSTDDDTINKPIHRTESEHVAERKIPTRGLSGINTEPNNTSTRSVYPTTQSPVQSLQNENNLLRMARPREQEKIPNVGEYKIAPKDVKLNRPERTIATETETVLQETALRETAIQGYTTQSFAETLNNSVNNPANPANPEREKKLLVSPRLEVETEGDPRAIVGQEALYRIRIINRGSSSAEQIVLTVEIPTWLEIAQPEISAGTTSIIPRESNKESRDFVWKVSRIEAQAEELLVLHLIPQQRKSVDLRIKYDFFKPATVAKIIVQEPILEMELQGPDEVLWGTKVGYKLLVRNSGNGDTENVKLELLQTGSDMQSCELPVLKAGEEQVIDVEVWTGKQEHIDINILATGQYDITAKVNKRVSVLRPNIVMAVDSPTVQFVGSPAEFQIKVQNIGNAAARDIVLSAGIPLGAKFISCTSGGELTPENQIVWKIDSILVGDVFSASVVCEPKREGTCKLETSISDKSGELANCVGSFEAEAIVELKLEVENPQGPVEIGQEAVYTLNVTNRGTKTAENIEIKAAFGGGLEPYEVEGENAFMSDGQVFFDKIPTVTSGQNVVLKIKAKADKPGNHRIRTEVICAAANVHLVNENTTYFYQKQKGKNTTVATSDSTTSTPTPATSTPTSETPTKTEDPFLK
ncbi:MAG: DUF11 domain-containing protein [Planctomycetaceae bacterium]|jgi:uncharacterized repeat protein (TIGR01451 family)|nr:DUF11 domain-containing protein [Planctomycetaceae bacterium]